jgi:hypothetical protein
LPRPASSSPQACRTNRSLPPRPGGRALDCGTNRLPVQPEVLHP